MNFIAAGLSDVGMHREHNEDSFCVLSRHRLFVVADGMGGHRGGDVASKLATHTIGAYFDASAEKSPEEILWPFDYDESQSLQENLLQTAVKIANQRIFQTSVHHAEVQGMGTTVVTAVFDKERGALYIAHVGDSRAYKISGGEITQLTRDHSLVNDYLLAMPHLSAVEREEIPTNVITRALGMQESVAVDVMVEDIAPSDRIVLCTDGLNGMLEDEAIMRAVSENPRVEDATHALIESANASGGEDNITAVVIEFQG